MLNKAELIERLKAGETMTEHYSKHRSSFWLGDERIHLTTALVLIRDGQVILSNDGKNYKWKGE